jgi:hypothetical protein
MNKITLAIPFYNTSQYFSDCIKYALDDDFIDEIVVNDDCSTQEHLNNLINIVESLNTNKIKLFRNESNIGAFRNKYQTVLNCSNEWIYMLDSDNHPFEETYNLIKDIPNTDPNICYCPSHLYCKNDNVTSYENISDYNFGYDLIGIEESKESLNNGTEWFNWFVNSGNYIFNKNTYLSLLEEPFKDFTVPLLHADTAAAFYYWLKNGGKFKVVEGLRHHHRLRLDSNWHSCGNNSQMSATYYERRIVEL